MASRKQEERNEKIIRGLMKLPPNRRCINCNSLGPQYVCPNFWTFVCTTCSGIHREFTHRVKSVSMSKFTSQEVEALQNGGNQRAREVYLKDWDLQRQRLPDSSKVEKIRDFIRSVYVDKKYAGGRTSEKPPRDMQSHRVLEDETRRASSYHSYSQSPPYDHQYEDRRYGKQASALTRKPGSDRGRYEGKMSSFVYSAGRLSEQMYEDRFENEGSGPRDSDYSVSSGGDASRSGVQSPNFPKDIGSSSPSFPPSWDNMTEVRCQAKNTLPESNVKRDATGIPCRQRTASSGSFGSVESYSMSLKSFNSGRFTDTVSEPEQATGTFQDKSTSLTGSSLFGSSDTLDLFKAPSKSEEVSSAALSIDLFQLPATSSSPSIDLFQPSVSSSASSMNINQPQGFSPASLELFAHFPQQQSTATLNNQVPNSVPKSEGWATFDSPQSSASIPGTENLPTAYIDSNGGGSMGKLDLFSSSNTQWQSFHYSGVNGPSSDISSPWSGGLQDVTAPTSTSTQSWNAFEVSTPLEGTKKDGEPGATDNLLSAGGHFLGFRISEDSSTYGIQRASSQGETHDPGLPSNVVLGQSYTPQVLPQMGEIQSHGSEQKSNNPFDLPYDTDLDQNNMFVDMSSLQASLPNTQLQSPFLGGVSQAWFPQNPVTGIPYIPAAAESGLTYMAGQAQSSQIPNVPTQEPIASIGGNPFA